eukprot:CAMPEP_0116912468 /NCGR_PEP_ID=MMETSP0467-20121206/16107_1 /TAXON_ID=283647 /ORGANISM="Mesodinium pulex, Strain SPMC105" /LENGTH=328 /DNA_ID=CAMNT_0004588459 /DNA_START=653 /DNA_END=1639 /DNA_ORIENTATION=+
MKSELEQKMSNLSDENMELKEKAFKLDMKLSQDTDALDSKVSILSSKVNRINDIEDNIRKNYNTLQTLIDKNKNVMEDKFKIDNDMMAHEISELDTELKKYKQTNAEKIHKVEIEFKTSLQNIERRNNDYNDIVQRQEYEIKREVVPEVVHEKEKPFKEKKNKDRGDREPKHREREVERDYDNFDTMSNASKPQGKMMMSEEIESKFKQIEGDVNNLITDIDYIKRSTVEEVMKQIEKTEMPNKDKVEQAIGKILSDRVSRSVSAPCRTTLKSNMVLYNKEPRKSAMYNFSDYRQKSFGLIFNDNDNINNDELMSLADTASTKEMGET